MALDAATAKDLVNKLAEDRATFLEAIGRTNELLTRLLETQTQTTGRDHPPLTTERLRRNTGATLATTTTDDVVTATKDSNFSIDEDSDTDDDESLFVQQKLPTESFDEEGLRKHIRDYPWTEAGKNILGQILDDDEVLTRRHLFPIRYGPVRDRSHLSHYSIFDVGNDGTPLPILHASEKTPPSRSVDIWNRISSINANPERQKQAVGRITIVREPSPLLFAALHYTMKDHFDMDKLFYLLETNKQTKAFAHSPWDDDPKHRNTFVFTLDYFTIVGDECMPMAWQKADEKLGDSETHVPVSRCSSVIALSLEANPVAKIRHRGRRNPLGRREGDIYDPFSPWHVISMQAYPDWKSSVDSHDSTKHYVNGPEAFLMTLRAEFKDAQKRLMEVYHRISDLVRTPSDFMFREAVRDKLLFEDDEFTYSRRYFWAYQSLAIMNEDIKEMLISYKSTFTESVWNGTSKIIWPGDENSARHIHWRKRMKLIRQDIERELRGLEEIDALNDEKMKEIKGLRDNLFSGTSVLESRRSVQQQAITVVQGNNIKILTLVTIFFLPLTFVTSVFGMTNMDPQEGFVRFGIVTIVICLPTYMLIGSLNTDKGFEFWTHKIHTFFARKFWIHLLAYSLSMVGIKPTWVRKQLMAQGARGAPPPNQPRPANKPRSESAILGMAARGGSSGLAPNLPLSPTHNIYPISPVVTHDRQSTVRFDSATKEHRGSNIPALSARIKRESSRKRRAGNGVGAWWTRVWGWNKGGEGEEAEMKEFP